MAKILHGAGIGDARGSVGGMTYTKGRYGAVLRQKVSPVQPRTSKVLMVRGLFAALSKLWASAAMDGSREGWNALAAITTYTNVFGNTYHPTGLQLFQSCNRNLDVVGETHINTVPDNLSVDSLLTLDADAAAPSHAVLSACAVSGNTALYTYGSYTGLVPAVGMSVLIAGFITKPANNGTFKIIAASGGASGTFSVTKVSQEAETQAATADATGFSITFTPSPPGADNYVVVSASGQMSGGRTNFGQTCNQVKVSSKNGTSPLDITTEYAALYGGFRAGTKIKVQAWLINSVNGAASTPISTTATVA